MDRFKKFVWPWLVLLSSCATSQSRAPIYFDWELRWPTGQRGPDSFAFAQEGLSFSASGFNGNWIKKDGGFSTYSWSDVMTGRRLSYILVETNNDRVARVFQIDPAAMPKCAAWSEWKEPVFATTSGYEIANGSRPKIEPKLNEPKIEFRYRVSVKIKC